MPDEHILSPAAQLIRDRMRTRLARAREKRNRRRGGGSAKERYQRLRTRPHTIERDFIVSALQTQQDIKRVVRLYQKEAETPWKIYTPLPIVSAKIPGTDFQLKNLIPIFGPFIPAGYEFERDPLTSEDYVSAVSGGKEVPLAGFQPRISWDSPPDEPGPGEVIYHFRTIFEDRYQRGAGVGDQWAPTFDFGETIFPQIPVPEINFPDWKFPDIGGIFGDLGKWALIGLVIIGVIILGKDKK